MNRYNFLRAFWSHYASLYPNSPKANRFRSGYAGSTPIYDVEGSNLRIRQWIGTYTVGTHIIGENVEKQSALYVHRIGEEYQDIDEFKYGKWCRTEYYPEEGEVLYDMDNWDEIAKWLEDLRQLYERILRP